MGVVEPRGDLAIKDEVLISAEYFAAHNHKSRKLCSVERQLHKVERTWKPCFMGVSGVLC